MNSDDSTAQVAQREIMLSLCNIRFQLIRMNALLICQMQFLAFVLLAQGELSEAARVYGETLEVRRGVLGPEHPNTLKSASDLASLLHAQGEYSEAARIHRETLEVVVQWLSQQ